MASNYTETIKLCQWLETDPVLRSDFNSDNKKIDAALKYMPRFVAGSYIGNGLSGEENPRSLSFTFLPMLVIITADSTDGVAPGSVFIRGQELSDGIGNYGNPAYGLALHLTWGDDRVTWYTSSNGDDAAENQLNKDGQTYRYFALGY